MGGKYVDGICEYLYYTIILRDNRWFDQNKINYVIFKWFKMIERAQIDPRDCFIHS